MILHHPIPDAAIPDAATLYWEAFGGKLGLPLGPDAKAHRFVARAFDPGHGISLHAPDGALLGVVGFKTAQGALVAGSLADMRAVYGLWGTLWRSALLALLDRDTENTRFVMDGLFVAPAVRGQGIGTRLLDAICAEARRRGYAAIRLDVIDSNTRARALYERQGFRAEKTTRLGLIRHVFGFASSTTMVKAL